MTNVSLIFCTANKPRYRRHRSFSTCILCRCCWREWRYLPANKTNNGAGAINSRNKKPHEQAAINISRLINSHGCLTLQSRDYAILHRKRPHSSAVRPMVSAAQRADDLCTGPATGMDSEQREKETLAGTFALCKPVTWRHRPSALHTAAKCSTGRVRAPAALRRNYLLRVSIGEGW